LAGAIVLERYSSIEEALVVQSNLRAHGIEAILDNWHHARNDWFLVHALDGIGVTIQPHDLDKSRQILTTLWKSTDNEQTDAFENDRRNRRLIRRW